VKTKLKEARTVGCAQCFDFLLSASFCVECISRFLIDIHKLNSLQGAAFDACLYGCMK
jgi:hypothetical protein